jgi:cyanophycin synthetase
LIISALFLALEFGKEALLNLLMKIVEVTATGGPNYWSGYRQNLIVMKVDLEDLEDYPTNTIDGFLERLSEAIPSLHSHRCSEDHEGGFFTRVKRGTWMGHVIEHIALELQTLAGMDCGFGRTRGTGQRGEYNIIFSYELERAGRYAGVKAVEIAQAIVDNKPTNVAAVVEELKRIRTEDDFGPSTKSIVEEARKRNIPYYRPDTNSSLVIFGQGVHQKRIRATMTCRTSSLGVETACDKDATKRLLKTACIPVPEGDRISQEASLAEVTEALGFPLAIKPVDGNHGRGITTNINTYEEALQAFRLAKTVSNEVVVERFLSGFDFRFLVINYKVVAVAKRNPAMVIGDGSSTIQQLINEVNSDPRRGDGHEKVLTMIRVDAVTESLLEKNGLTLDSVLPIGKPLVLKDTANLSTGGTAEDVTDRVHPYNVQMAERIARLMNLDICGIDIISQDVAKPIKGSNGGVIEVNACPGFRMHTHPGSGLARNVGEAVIRMLYPDDKKSRVPIVAVTGTNGKTTTTRLMAHFARTAGHHTGYTTTDGIYIDGNCIQEGDCTGPVSARVVLHDPSVEFAVLECARGGILRAGLGFDYCDVAIVTNISGDHLGLKGIDTMEKLARVKAVVANAALPAQTSSQPGRSGGYCVLNADDDLVYAMREEVDAHVALFSMRANNPRVRKHCESGGMAAVVEKGYLTILKGHWKTRIGRIADIPLSMNGTAPAMIKNLLAATLGAVACNFRIDAIRSALATFIPSPEFTPGRMNIFHFNDFDVMIDYAHNPAGFSELATFFKSIDTPSKIGIVAAVGDRRDEDIIEVGAYAASIFDRIIIRHDDDLRGRTRDELNVLLLEGIRRVDPAKPVDIVSDEIDAIRHAMLTAAKGAFISVFSDKVHKSIEFVSQAREREMQHVKNYVFSQAS